MGFLSRLTTWLFGKNQEPSDANLADPVYIQMVRHNLQTLRDRHGPDGFARTGDFLDALDQAVNSSALGKITLGGSWARTGAARNIFDAVTSGKTPFFYAIAPDAKPMTKGLLILPENCYVPVTMLAEHALYLLDTVHETMLADIYATALAATAVQAGQALKSDSRLTYEDGRGAGRFVQGIAPHKGNIVSALYLRAPQKPPRPPMPL